MCAVAVCGLLALAATTAPIGVSAAWAEASEADAGGGEKKKAKRTEFGILPAINYDSDLGFGFGAIGTLAAFEPGYRPYRWRLEFLLYATVKESPDGGAELPYHDDYLILDLPGLLQNRLRLRSRVGFQRISTAGYYGLGNASEELEDADGRYHQYDRINPHIESYGRFKLWDRSTDEHAMRLEAFGGFGFWYNIIKLYDGSLLAQQQAEVEQGTPDGAALSSLLNGLDDHAMLTLSGGLLFDTRDHEYAPTRGSFTELSVRASPGVDADLRFAGFTLNTRWFHSLYGGDKLVLAVRGIGDVLVGSVPIYELATLGAFNNVSGPGGGSSVRGVLFNRFLGKLKVVGNAELRAQLLPFSIGSQQFNLGVITFVDAGRVWADFEQVEVNGQELDNSLPNFALGVGAGLRVRWGETFIVRADPAYSLTEETFGLYININHIF
ncbi:MAG: hypothetical protein Tsb0020_28470 [Haliangiales bacterium]